MRIFLAALVALSLSASVLTIPAAAQFSFLGFKNSMVQFLLDQLSTEGVFEIRAGEVLEPDDGVTAITNLTIADSEGVWFSAQSLDFSWSPSRLLRGEVEFNTLALRGVEISRPPVAEVEVDVEQESEEPAALTIEWPRSPITLRIEGIQAESVRLAEPVIGHAMHFDATGQAVDEGEIQSVRLDITRRDTVEGEIRLDYERRFDTNTFKLNLDAKEGPSGLIAALSGLPDDAASTATIRADGPPEDWRMDLKIALAETVDLEGQAAISYEGPLKVDASFIARPGAQLAPDLARLLGTESRLEAKAEEGPDGTILIERGYIDAPDIDLTAAGSYSRVTGAADLKLDLEARGGLAEPVPDLDFETLTFAGTVQGAPGTMAADGDLVLNRLRSTTADLDRASLAIDVRQSEAGEDLTTTTFAVKGDTAQLRLDKLGPDILGDPFIDIAGSLTGSDLVLERAQLIAEVLSLGIKGQVNTETTDANVELEIAAPDFAPVGAAYGIDISGEVIANGQASRVDEVLDAFFSAALVDFGHELADAERLAVTANVKQSGENISFDVSGSGTRMRLDKVPADLLGELEFDAKGGLEGQKLTLTAAEVTSNLLKAAASGVVDLDDQSGQIDYRAETSDLAPITALYDVPLGGIASVNGAAILAEAPRVDGAARVDGLVYDGTGYGDLQLDHDIALGDVIEGDIALSLDGSPYGDVDLATALRFAEPVLDLSGLDLKALGTRAQGNVTHNTQTTLAEGKVALNVADLGSLQQVTGTRLRGRVAADLTLSHANGQQNADAVINLRNFITDGASVESARVNGAFRDLLGTPRIDTRLQAGPVTAGELVLSKTTATLRGALAQLAIAAELEGKVGEEPLTASLTGTADADGPEMGVRLSGLTASYAEEQLSLNQPLNVSVRGSNVNVTNMDIALPRNGNLSGAVLKYGNGLRGEISLSGLDATLAKKFADAPVLAGQINANATFDTGRGPADLRLDATGMKFENVDVEGTLDLSSTVNWDGARAQADATLEGNFGEPLRISGNFPLRRGLVPSIPPSGPVEGSVTWQGDIGDLFALVPAAGHILTGNMDIDLAVSGDISDPQLGGSVSIADGGYQNLDIGTILTDLTLQTEAKPGGDLGFRLDAKDGAEGTVVTEGEIALDASGLDIRTEIRDAVLVRRDEATARVDGEITISGPVENLTVDGDIVLKTVEVRLVSSGAATIPDLGEVTIKGEEKEKEPAGSSRVRLRLDISSPGRIFVRGRGLDATFGMDLKVRGTAARPRVQGEIARVRGILDLIGKRFDLETGRVIFDGGREIDPRIDVVFQRETEDLTGRIEVSGRASDPQLGFSSSPSLPEDEVLPRTIFGKSSQALSGSQAIQLALGLATLMQGGGGTLDDVRNAVGLDQLRVEQDDDGNASVAAGKEISEGVFVGAKQGLTNNETSVIVEIDLFDDFKVDAEVGQESGSSVGLKWKKDF